MEFYLMLIAAMLAGSSLVAAIQERRGIGWAVFANIVVVVVLAVVS